MSVRGAEGGGGSGDGKLFASSSLPGCLDAIGAGKNLQYTRTDEDAKGHGQCTDRLKLHNMNLYWIPYFAL